MSLYIVIKGPPEKWDKPPIEQLCMYHQWVKPTGTIKFESEPLGSETYELWTHHDHIKQHLLNIGLVPEIWGCTTECTYSCLQGVIQWVKKWAGKQLHYYEINPKPKVRLIKVKRKKEPSINLSWMVWSCQGLPVLVSRYGHFLWFSPVA